MPITVKFEKGHAEEFLCSEGNGRISREVGTVAAGQVLEPGTILSFNESDETLEATVNGTESDVIGILSYRADTSSDGPEGNADKEGCVYISRDCEFDASLIIVPDNARTAALAALLALGMVAR